MAWSLNERLQQHLHRLAVGLDHFMIATGGVLGVVSMMVAIAVADNVAVTRGALAVAALGMVMMVYGTGKRVLELEDKIDRRWKKEKLAHLLMKIEVRRGEVSAMSAEEYLESLTRDGEDWVDKETEDVLYGATKHILTNYGSSAVLLTLSNSGMKFTQVDPFHPCLLGESSRQKVLDQMDHYAAQMKHFIKGDE